MITTELTNQALPKRGSREVTAARNPPKATRKRKEPPAPQPNRTAPPSGQELNSLLSYYRVRYKSHPPKSDVAFIWEFLDAIDDDGMSKHIQDSLVSICPEYVTAKRRDLRNRVGRRRVNIQEGLTWKNFQRILVEVPRKPST